MSLSPTAPLRIAFVSNRCQPSVGGIETRVVRLAASLSAAGHEVTVLTHDLEGDASEREEVAGLPVRRFLPPVPYQRTMGSRTLAHHLSRAGDQYDVVHVHADPETPAALATRWWAGPLVLSPYHHATGTSRLRAALHVPHPANGRRVLDRADAVVCTSATERRALLTAFPAAHARTVVVTDGVDVDRLRARHPMAPPDGRAHVLTVGRLQAYRRVDLVVSAMGLLRGDHHLDVVGDGPERRALETQVARLGLEGCVTFHGTVSEEGRARSIASAACIVSLATHESQGSMFLEAAASGSPIVASAIEAHVETQQRVGDLLTLVPATAGARTVARAVRAAAARPRRPLDMPTWADVAWSMAHVYHQVLARSPHTRWRIPA